MGKKKGKGKSQGPAPAQEQSGGSQQQVPPQEPPQPKKQEQVSAATSKEEQTFSKGKGKTGQGKQQYGDSQGQHSTEQSRGTQPPQTAPPGQQQTGPPPKQQTGHPSQQQKGSAKGGKGPQSQQQVGHPSQQQAGYPSQKQAGYPSQQHAGYPSQQQAGHPSQHQKGGAWGGKGPQSQQQAGHPSQQQAGYPSQQQAGYPSQQQTGHPSQQQKGSAWGGKGPQSQQQAGHPSQQQAGYPSQQHAGYPSQQQAGYPSQQQAGYPSKQQAGYPSQQQARYPSQQQAGYPSPQHAGYPPQQQAGYPSQQQVGYPSQHQAGHPSQQQKGGAWGGKGPQSQQQAGHPSQQQAGYPSQQQAGYPSQQQAGFSPQQQAGHPSQQQAVHPPQHKMGQGGVAPQQHGDTPRQQPQQPMGPRPGSSGDQAAKKRSPGGTPKKDAANLTQQLVKMDISESSSSRLKYINVVPGKQGRVIKIETNHLAMSLGNLKTAYHYDVNIVPDTPKKFLRDVMEIFRKQMFPNRYPAFDGRKNLYSAQKLPIDGVMSATILFGDSDRKKEYKVEVKFANAVDMTGLLQRSFGETPREALQVVDIVLRSAPAVTMTAVGRSFFHRMGPIHDLGEGMEMYPGFYQTAVRGWKPLLNVDVAHKAFPKCMPVKHALEELLSTYRYPVTLQDLSRGLTEDQLRTFEKYIKMLKVTYEIDQIASSRRSYRVNGLGAPANVKKFRDESGTEMTIEQYFSRKYKKRLQFPNLPTLWVGNRERVDKILVPLEFCKIESNQVVNRKMTENQTSAMIKHAATDTTQRKRKIMDALHGANHNSHPTVKEFGFSIANQFEKLEARVLEPPVLRYLENQVRPARGVWTGTKFVNGAVINNWTIICALRVNMDRIAENLNNLATTITRESQGCGMLFNNPPDRPFQIIGFNRRDIISFFQRNKDKYDVIFVVVPDSGSTYSFVKSAAEINTGCLTQCLKLTTLNRRINRATVINILLKVNAKRNGLNHFLFQTPDILKRPCMIMGADVTHPSPDSQNIPSVAAVTASHEPRAFKYNICWRLQPPTQEIIQDLAAIVEEQLMYFYKSNNSRKPEKIVFFRDGVSEGQFEQVIQHEIRAIRAACKKVQRDDYEPKITFLVVQKRHHTRLFPLDSRDSQDRNCNVPAGTCVDKDITHPYLQDFYMVSHASIQGVAKPTKYCTLWDDNDMSNDEIEALTYHLCHMFTRCTRSVSYPAPTYYAHLAAARAKVYIENEQLDMDNLDAERLRFRIQNSIIKDLPMFFV